MINKQFAEGETPMKRIPLLPSILMLLFMALAIYAFVPHTAVVAQTVPTRTPTPAPGGGGGGGTEPVDPPPGGGGGTEPVNPPPGGGGGSEPNTPVPPTAVPTNTPTPRPVNIAPTPVGGFVTPEACGDPLFVASRGPVNVRQGPGTNYALTGELVFLEGRPIIGRAENAAWWLILLADDSEGWVANSTGTVYGYGTLAPIVPPPPINGATPTPGPLFQPTPNSSCAIPPTQPPPSPTASATALPTATPTATPLVETTTPPTADASAEPKPESLAASDAHDNENEGAEVASEITPRLAEVASEVEPTATPPQSPTLIADVDTAVDTATTNNTTTTQTENETETGGNGLNWFLFGGLGLILLGLAGFGIQRFR